MDPLVIVAMGFAFMLILEGIIPFLFPSRWRSLVAQLALISNSQLRVVGLGSMLAGLGIMYWVS